LLIPIQVGTTLANERYEGYVHDDEGDNISFKNKSYCELTAQYWAWKNCEADYYGFFHYRRYMSFVDEQLGDIESYVKFLYCTDEIQQKIGLNNEQVHKVVESYDVITVIPKTFDNNETVRSQYAKLDVQFIDDLDEVCLDIIKAKYPEIYDSAVKYLNGNICYFCNMFIARKNIFERYNKFLFDVLEEFENGKDFTYYNTAQYRVFGYLGERLWGIFYCYLKHVENVKTKELQRVEFKYTHPLAIPNVDCNTVNIVISSSDYYTPYAIVLLKSLAINSKKDRNYNFIVFNLGLKDTNKQLFKNNISEYSNFKITFIDITPITSRYELQGKGYVSMHSWLRLFAPFVLSEYDKIIYLDSDMIINHDVSELYDTS